jgi:murein DD-endopeptidase MepM/ murein hydrolase activator NlpD
MMVRRSALLLSLLLLTAWARAEEKPRFILPVDCEPGLDCFVQNHVDVDPGPGALDFTCGPLTYDGHKGTDIRVASLAEMRAGVAVLAAARGRVMAVRDGEPDSGWRTEVAAKETRRECGNGVLVTHGDGWLSQYCHMKRGSIAVRPGQAVRAGARLGEIGFSGKTEFPHLHFAVRRNKVVIDPFSGREAKDGCATAATAAPLWSEAAGVALAYRPSGLLGAGFSARRPRKEEVEDGQHRLEVLPGGAPVLVFWVEVFGLRQGDVERLRIYGPGGRPLASSTSEAAARNRAIQFRFVGKRRRGGAWAPGRYLGEYRLLRRSKGDLVEVLRVSRTVDVR